MDPFAPKGTYSRPVHMYANFDIWDAVAIAAFVSSFFIAHYGDFTGSATRIQHHSKNGFWGIFYYLFELFMSLLRFDRDAIVVFLVYLLFFGSVFFLILRV